MVNINISLPDELHTKLKLAAALNDVPLKDYVQGALKRSIAVPSASSSISESKSSR